MEDEKIVELYFQRNEDAIAESENKYGTYLERISFQVVRDHSDAEECVSDTWMRAWNAIPPTRPNSLKAFFTRITRNLSINRLEEKTAGKRGGSEYDLCLDELEECVADKSSVEDAVIGMELDRMIQAFLSGIPKRHRIIFMQRYFYMCPVAEIAGNLGITEGNVKSLLFRTRKKLKEYLEKEGIAL